MFEVILISTFCFNLKVVCLPGLFDFTWIFGY